MDGPSFAGGGLVRLTISYDVLGAAVRRAAR